MRKSNHHGALASSRACLANIVNNKHATSCSTISTPLRRYCDIGTESKSRQVNDSSSMWRENRLVQPELHAFIKLRNIEHINICCHRRSKPQWPGVFFADQANPTGSYRRQITAKQQGVGSLPRLLQNRMRKLERTK